MRTSVSCLKPGAVQNRRIQSRQLAAAIQARRVQFLNMTIQQAAEFAGLGAKRWVDLESGWIPPQDDVNLWIWWALASSLEVKAGRLFCLASADLAHGGLLAKESGYKPHAQFDEGLREEVDQISGSSIFGTRRPHGRIQKARNFMSMKDIVAAVLMVGAAALVAVGAILVEPRVLAVAIVPALTAVIIRLTDKDKRAAASRASRQLTYATGSQVIPRMSLQIPMPPGAAIPARPMTGQTLDPISLPAEQAEQMQALYDLLSKDGKPRLVGRDGEPSLDLPDVVCELLLKVVGGLQQGKAISIAVAEEPTDSAY